MTNTSTPRADGFYMPAEWAPQSQVWMLWPERPDSWRMGGKPAQAAFIAVARAIARFEAVTVGVSTGQFVNASEQFVNDPAVRVVEMSNNDAWMRDVGPTFLINDGGEIAAVDWEFNAWGGLDDGLYFPWDLDNQVARKVAQLERVKRYPTPDFVLEGGSIHVDGEGTLLTTAECLLNANRNPHLSQADIEAYLRDYLGVSTIIWLPHGMYSDETNGHIDNFCCFVRPGEVLLCWTDNPEDPNYSRCSEALAVLENSIDTRGRRLRVHKIPIPEPIHASEEACDGVDRVPGAQPRLPYIRLAASYVNFLVINGAVIMPGFDDPADEVALALLRELFPEREVVMLPGREILFGGGNIHCITQQQPLP
ncbi:MAG TPA: agmatine deiminase [Kineobactrum sp.]